MNKQMYIDTHCHLYQEYYDNLEETINNAKAKGVGLFIVNGCDKKSNQEVLELTKKYPEIYGAIGFHPTELALLKDEDLSWLEEHLHDDKIIAIGEIGLDYHYENTNQEKEILFFKKQLSLAEKYHLPVIIHSRDATKDTLDILNNYHLKGIVHGFSGSLETAREYLKKGFKLGINGVVTFKNAHLKEIIKEVGLENIVLETDSPYLTPHPYRGQRNDPSYLTVIVDFLAEYLNISPTKILAITNQNVQDLLFNK